MRGVFVARLGHRRPFRKRWNYERLMPPSIVPCAREGHFPIALLPQLSFFMPAYQGENSARGYGNVGAANDLEQAKGMSHFLVAPLVSADHSYPQNLDFRRLNQQKQGLHVAATGSGTILVDDDLAPLLGPTEGACQQQTGDCQATNARSPH